MRKHIQFGFKLPSELIPSRTANFFLAKLHVSGVVKRNWWC